MFLKHAGRGELAQFMTHHVLGDKDREKSFPVVHQKGVSHEVRCDHGAARPGFDRFFGVGLIELVNFVQQMLFHEGTFFKRSSHDLFLFLPL